jgi:thiosulfate reductase cytochrome b subunit
MSPETPQPGPDSPADPEAGSPAPDPSGPPVERDPVGPAASVPATGESSVTSAAPAEPVAEAARVEPARPRVKRHHWIVRVTHWASAVALAGLVASGLRIYQAFGHFGDKGGRLGVWNPFDHERFGGFPAWAKLGSFLAPALNWHFALAWVFTLAGLVYLGYLAVSGEWRSLLFRPRDVRPAVEMQLYYLRLRREHPPQGKHNALQKLAYDATLALGALSVLTGFALYKPVQLAPLTALFGGFELTRYWHFVAVWLFVAFTVVHVLAVLLADPQSLRAMITGWYRGRYPSHD